jgi:hypothetical protein
MQPVGNEELKPNAWRAYDEGALQHAMSSMIAPPAIFKNERYS